MDAFHFGTPNRQLFGMLHSVAGAPRDDRAVLLCNPFGQEAVRSHRFYRVLADRLAARGLPTLRFDYHGTGDAPGDDEEGDLDGWVDDARVALRELQLRSGAKRIVCMGARLGAALAARAASGVAAVSRLVLLDPVVHGAAYLDLLRVKHVEALESSFSIADPRWRRELAEDPQAFTAEAIGFGMSSLLRQQIRKLGPHSFPMAPGVQVHVIAHPDDAAVRAWFAPYLQQAAGRHLSPLEQAFDWTAEESNNNPLVPAQVLNTTLSSICD